MDSIQAEPTVWRIQLKPGGRGHDTNVAAYCVRNNIIGTGWGIDEQVNGWDEYYRKYMIQNPAFAEGTFDHRRWRANTHRLIVEIRENDLVWFRDKSAPQYYIGRITGPWNSRNDPEARENDIRLVRPVEIVSVDADVPGKVLAAFRASRTLQKVANETVRELAKLIFNRQSGHKKYTLTRSTLDVFQLLDDRETEDLVAVYLQYERGYIFSPASRYQDNPTFEFFVVHRDSKIRAGVQVKTGNIRLKPTDYQGKECEVFLFSPAGYLGEQVPGVECLDSNMLRQFLRDQGQLFSPALRYRIEALTKST